MSLNDKSKLLAEALCLIRESEIAACQAIAIINRLRRERGENPLLLR